MQKDAIKAAKSSKGVTILLSKRTPQNGEMERLLWIKEKEIGGDTLTKLEPLPQTDVIKIVNLGKAMRLKVDADDINDFIKKHHNKLTTEKLKELQERLNGEEEKP